MQEHNYSKQDGQTKNSCESKELNSARFAAFADALAVSFQGYPLFEYFLNYNYSAKKMRVFWRASLKTVLECAHFVTDGEELHSVAVLLPNEKSYVSIRKYLKAGGLRMILKMGLPAARRMLRFESFAEQLKAKYVTPDCWYFYAFATLSDFRGQGLGTSAMQDILQFLDEKQQDCYLETMKPENVNFYGKFGFELKEAVKYPHADFTVYAMYRPFKKADS